MTIMTIIIIFFVLGISSVLRQIIERYSAFHRYGSILKVMLWLAAAELRGLASDRGGRCCIFSRLLLAIICNVSRYIYERSRLV